MKTFGWIALLMLLICIGGFLLTDSRQKPKPLIPPPQKVDTASTVSQSMKYPLDIPVDSSRPVDGVCTRVLMIGNSYTFYNAMPWLMESFSERDARPLRVTVVAYPNLSFTEHRTAGVEKIIREQKWDFVVLQDYSLGPLMAAEAFHSDGAALVAEVKATGAVPILYQTWARESTPETQADLSAAYAMLAEKSGARVARVGDAWASLRKLPHPPALHDLDGSHPTPEGSYTAACVLYATILGRSPEGLPRTVAPTVRKSRTWVMADGAYDLPAETAAAIQAAAAAVTTNTGVSKPAQ